MVSPSNAARLRRHMNSSARVLRALGFRNAAACVLLAAALPLTSSAQVSFAEFPVPTANSGLQGITRAPDGAVWFAEHDSGNIGRITQTGVFTEYSVGAETGPNQIVVGPDNKLYFTVSNASFIGQIDPLTSPISIKQFPISGLASNTIASTTGIAVGSDGNIWFAAGGTAVNSIGWLDLSTGSIPALIPIPTPKSIPTSLTLGPDGNIWFTEQCPTVSGCSGIGAIGTVRSGAITEFSVGANTQPFGITSDGTNLWFTEEGADSVVKIDTSGSILLTRSLSSGAAPLGITLGLDGALWVAESGKGKIAQVTTSGVLSEENSTPTQPSGPYGIAVGPDRALWFTSGAANQIGRISAISFELFTNVPGALATIAVGADGSVYGINSGGAIYTYNEASGSTSAGWTNIPGALSTTTGSFSVGSKNAVWGLNEQSNIYHLNSSDNTWTQIPGQLAWISAGADGEVWGLNTNNNIYRLDPASNTFYEIQGTLSSIRVGSAGAVYGLNPFGSIYWYNPGAGAFDWITGSVGFGQVAVGIDGDLWAIKNGTAYHYDVLHATMAATAGASGLSHIVVGSGASVFALGGTDPFLNIYQWDATAQSWVQLGGNLAGIAAGANGAVWGINASQQIYRLQGAPLRAYQTFNVIANNSMDQISVGADGTVWGMSGGAVQFFNRGTQTFQTVAGAPHMTQVSVGAGNDVWGVDCPSATADTCSVYEYLAGSSPTWNLIPGELNQIHVSARGDVWGINAGGQIYYYDFTHSSWVNIPGTLGQLSLGADGTVWGINGSMQIYRYSGGTDGAVGTFDNIPGSLLHVSAGSADNVWGINSTGAIYTDANSFTTPIPGTLDQIWASFDGAVWGSNANNSAYQWNASTHSFGFAGNNIRYVIVGNAVNVWGANDATGAVYAWF